MGDCPVCGGSGKQSGTKFDCSLCNGSGKTERIIMVTYDRATPYRASGCPLSHPTVLDNP
ncbi:hypothetical protein M430DRAFT_50527 [Amorphotheca resinae ATCC 22711]|uniref:CR-type domain-containing protein n=1 Tax=Amorphotheca resinae ATCC 22711 TaxID=857342 RepID=A0A2T3B1V0_AMORE|nr:hypothetical protein M430DRAFT_50527 [Amorphotheca resinae ATCC 22711]PSS18519.1 hypothetical protein M430DRAFT_50527 [Amorphotheca resinae ATCC 22711]